MREQPYDNRPPVLERDQPPAQTPSRPSWLPVLASAGASLLLIALMAALLVTHAGQRTTPVTAAATAATTAVAGTATPSGPHWQDIDSYTHVAGIVLAPSNPRTAYQGLLTSSKTAPTTLTLQRTRDAGATWQPIALPAVLQGLSPDAFQFEGGPGFFMVSPLNATTVYFSSAADMPNCPNTIGRANGQATSQARAGGVRLALPTSSGLPCYTQYYSTDGAQTWHDLKLPISNLLEGLRPQGARLWALISPPFVAQDTTPPAGRLARSEDGGITWSLADSSLPSSVGIAEYMPAPSGNTVFVVSDRADRFNSGVCQGCLPPPDYKLWRSDDLGGHWTQVTALPYQGVVGLWVGRGTVATQPALYLQVITDTSGAQVVLASGDGGHAWAAAPAAGVDASTRQSQGLWGVLADGSAIGIYSPQGNAQYSVHTFYAWKAGASTWRPIAPQLASPFLLALIVGPPAADGSQVLTLLYQDHDGNLVATYPVR